VRRGAQNSSSNYPGKQKRDVYFITSKDGIHCEETPTLNCFSSRITRNFPEMLLKPEMITALDQEKSGKIMLTSEYLYLKTDEVVAC